MNMVEFCPKCGSIMIPKNVGGKRVLVCTRCGFIKEVSSGGYVFSTRITHSEKEKIIVLEPGKMPRTLPKIKGVTCPKCGNDEAYYWMIQTRRADEPATTFYKCTKCGHVWREYE